MRNQDRISTPYILGYCASGAVTVAGLNVGAAADTDDGAVIALKTNGGVVVTIPAYTAQTAEPEPDSDPDPDPG